MNLQSPQRSKSNENVRRKSFATRAFRISALLLGLNLIPFFGARVLADDAARPTDNQALNIVAESVDYLPTESKLNRVERTPLSEIERNFANPGVDFATAPLWVWNDLLTEDQIRSTLQDLSRQGVNQAFVHPRPGLATPYLTDDWFRLWDAALDEGAKNGMKIWIYDENSYPSGFAGGYVPDALPESRGFGLDVVLLDSLVDANGKWQAGEEVRTIYEELSDGTTCDRTKEILDARDSGAAIPEKSANGVRWVVSRIQYAGSSQWFGGKTYVNLLTPGVLESFLTFTHEAYRNRLGDKLGKQVPGAFTDEPQIAPAGMFSWTNDFPQEFKHRRGYDLEPKLASLVAPIGDWKKVRFDYYKTALELLIDRWHKPLGAYCEKVGLEYTGHDWEHDWPGAHGVPDSMATAFWRQRPAIDLLMGGFSRGTHSQFGNVRSVRELNSIGRQAGRGRTISENYGAGGYDIRFEDLKRLGDWSYALGVNTCDEHLSYISIRGARKHDHPQTFSYHSPWFEQYSKLESYWTRLSYLLSRGELTSERFLLIEPTTTAWFYQQNAGNESGKLAKIGDDFADLLNRLEAAQVDYDLGAEDVIERVGNVDGKTLCVGAARYETVVLPPNLENLTAKTVALLARFVQNGGNVVLLGAPLERVEGVASAELDGNVKNDFATLTNASESLSFDALVEKSFASQPVAVVAKTNPENVFHQVRETADARIVFVCNVDKEKSADGSLALANGWEDATLLKFDASTGEIARYNGTSFELGPCGSLALVVSKSADVAKLAPQAEPTNAFRVDPWKFADRVKINPNDDNVLVLDYMSVKSGGEELKDEYFYRANAWFWRQKGFPMSPWDNGVQFKDELITKRFADESGFEVVYRFNKSDAAISNLRFVVESPDQFDVYCNGEKVERIPNAWKFDRAFGVFDVSKQAKPGVNEMKLVAPKSMIFTELMPAWIVGDFSLEPRDVGFEIVAKKELKFNPNAPVSLESRHNDALEGVSWLSSGVGFSNADDRSPSISFRFPAATRVDAIRVWNYCEANLAKRGVKRFTIAGVGDFELRIGDGSPQLVELPNALQLESGQTINIVVRENWNKIEYPLPADFVGSTAPDNDNAFVGLAEVQFLTRDANGAYVPLDVRPNVSASSELVYRNHERRAEFCVDGSGLMFPRPTFDKNAKPGEIRWASEPAGLAAQGWPFYAGSVDYSFKINANDVPKDGSIQFELPGLRKRWNGAVAAILVDGAQVGAIAIEGETVDVAEQVRNALKANGETVLTARIYATPKNLFGPHHAGQLRLSAWPGSFHSAPEKQPAGDAYDVIEYGLFTY